MLCIVAQVLPRGGRPRLDPLHGEKSKKNKSAITCNREKLCVHISTLSVYRIVSHRYTVKPPNKGHIGDGPVVPCREVVLFLEVFF